jgi:hypothetical protein
MNTGTAWKEVLLTCEPALVSSTTPMVKAREESFSSATTLLTSGGRAILKACGKVMSMKVCHFDSPSALAASICPLGTACRPERMASAL